MDVEKIAYEIIDEIISLPPEVRLSGQDSGLENVWDEYKEQIQYEECDFYSFLQDMIDGMVDI